VSLGGEGGKMGKGRNEVVADVDHDARPGPGRGLRPGTRKDRRSLNTKRKRRGGKKLRRKERVGIEKKSVG